MAYLGSGSKCPALLLRLRTHGARRILDSKRSRQDLEKYIWQILPRRIVRNKEENLSQEEGISGQSRQTKKLVLARSPQYHRRRSARYRKSEPVPRGPIEGKRRSSNLGSSPRLSPRGNSFEPRHQQQQQQQQQ